MFLLGTDCFFAFWMASTSVGLPDGSGPPIFAAISMFLIILAKSLPRLASIAAFLCFVVAHLEWPDMGPSSVSVLRVVRSGPVHQVEERPVHARVSSDLRVEGGRHQGALADGDDPTAGRS